MSSCDDGETFADPGPSLSGVDRVEPSGFEQLVEGLPEAFVLYDQTGRITFANDDFRRRAGRTLSELLGKRPFEWDDGSFADAPEVERYRQHLDATLATGEPSELDRVNTMPSGNTEVHHFSFRAQFDAAGRVVGALMFAQDRSEIARARGQAERSAHEFRMLADHLPDQLVRYDIDGRATYVNAEVRARTMRTPEQMIGVRPFPDDPPNVIGSDEYVRKLDEVLATGESRQVGITRILPGGARLVHDHIIQAERNLNGEITGAFAIGRDVTELVRAREETAAREHEYRTLTTNLPDTVVRYDVDGRAIYQNHRIGTDPDGRPTPVLGLRPTEIDLPGMTGIEDYERRLMHTIATGAPNEAKVVIPMPIGRRIHSLLIRAEHDDQGAISGALVIGRDITDLVRARQEVLERELQFRSLAENLPEVLIRYDRDGVVVYVNRQYERQISARSPLGTNIEEWRSVVGSRFCDRVQQVLRSGEPSQIEMPMRSPNRDERIHIVLLQPEFDAAGDVTGVITIGHDVTDLINARLDVAARERNFRSLAENATDYIGRWDCDGRRLYVNPALADLMGAPAEQLVGQPSTGGLHGEFAELTAAIRRCAADATARTIQHSYVSPDAEEERVHEVGLVPEFDEHGTLVSVLGVGRDVTEVVRQREELEQSARTDPLTGVSTRKVLYERLPAILERRHAAGARTAMLLVDLDGFKHINDQHGHRLGDRILREVGNRLSTCIGDDDLLVRLGGDEFVLVTSNIEAPSDASLLAHQVRMQLAELEGADDVRFPPIDASIGMSIFPDDGHDVDVLLGHADLALYAAKRVGRGRVEFFRPELRAAMERRSAIEQALRDASPDMEMALHLQPICSLDTDPHVWGVEALLRWHHSQLGPVDPDEFIPIAEQSGQIVPLGRWVLRRAAEMAAELNQERTHPLRVTVNVSTRQFTLDDISAAVRDALHATGCDPRWIVLELTESLLLEDLPLVHRSLDQLRAIGVGIAIDDFGTGYSALHYLTKLQIDHMKIDKSFVCGTDVDHQQQEVVRALVAMASALGIGVVAEGIETSGQADFLRNLGCQLGQGYLMARPMPLHRFEEWLDTATATLRETLPA